MALIINRKPAPASTMLDDIKALDPVAEAPIDLPWNEPVAAPLVEPEPVAVAKAVEPVVAAEEPAPLSPSEEDDEGLPPEDIHMLAALEAYAKKTRVGTLMIVKLATGEPYEVLGFGLSTRRVSLRCRDGAILNPLVGDREARLYRPLWR